MDKPDISETNLRVFNTGKLFSEQIIFPLMLSYKKFQRQANYGHENLDNSLDIPQEIRDIQRFNGLKGMAESTYDLLNSISSTVNSKGNKEEREQIANLKTTIKKVIDIFYTNRESFFKTTYKDMYTVEELNRIYFNKIKDIIEICYINSETLMTRNKILFADSNDEFKSDKEIMEDIKREYTEV